MGTDVHPSKIVATHEPWHATFRYLGDSPEMDKDVLGGSYDRTGDENTDKAVGARKAVLAGTVMLGGKLGSGPRERKV